MLLNFALSICKCTTWWEESAFIVRAKEELQRAIGGGKAVCVVSGGLDTTVCALLAEKAVADRVHCVLVDTGLLREGEPEWVADQLRQQGLRVQPVDARARMAEALRGAVDGAGKRAAVQRVIAQVVEAEVGRIGGATVLLRGTNYSDIVVHAAGRESESGRAGQQTGLTVVEPLRDLFRNEVYRVGELLELPPTLLQRQPFPDCGLAVRVFGEATRERLDTLRAADAIFRAEVEQAGLARKLWKYYATLAQMPDGETAGQVVVLRAVQQSELIANPSRLPYDLLERVVGRIQSEVSGICRVVYDVTAAVHMRDEL